MHLTQGARGVRHARKELGADAIVGAFCGASRHEGMNAGEAGADYVSFAPPRSAREPPWTSSFSSGGPR